MITPPPCSHCGQPKTGYKNARYAGGIQWQCRACTQKRQHELHGIKAFRPATQFCDKHQADKVKRTESSGAVKWRCLACDREKYAARMADDEKRARMQEYRRQYVQENVGLCRTLCNEWKKANPQQRRKDASKRRAAQLSRTCAWADEEAIKAKYKEARWMSERTGIPHDVDHFYPLQGELVSGLHVAANLRVIPSRANTRKHNKLPKTERLPL